MSVGLLRMTNNFGARFWSKASCVLSNPALPLPFTSFFFTFLLRFTCLPFLFSLQRLTAGAFALVLIIFFNFHFPYISFSCRAHLACPESSANDPVFGENRAPIFFSTISSTKRPPDIVRSRRQRWPVSGHPPRNFSCRWCVAVFFSFEPLRLPNF